MSRDVAELTPPRYLGMTLRTLLENSDILQMPVPRNFVKDGQKKDGNWEESFDATAAFLGPTLWDKTVPYSDEFKMEYMDLDEFLCENGISVPASDVANNGEKQRPPVPTSTNTAAIGLEKSLPPPPPPPPQTPVLQSPQQRQPEQQQNQHTFQKPIIKEALATSPGHDIFDPRVHTFNEEELKPQPMIKKSKKQFVPDNLKDEKYWSRRKKNNLAAKRSRDARRIKENQIALRASFLEKENNQMKKEIDSLKSENAALKDKLAKYERC